MNEQLKKKVDFAVRLLQSIPNDEPIEISYSGGKDSDVILELAKMAGIKYRAIYKNTTIDPPGIDWEQRRYEIAKEIMAGYASNNLFTEIPDNTLAGWSVLAADALIEQLKQPKQ